MSRVGLLHHLRRQVYAYHFTARPDLFHSREERRSAPGGHVKHPCPGGYVCILNQFSPE